MAGSALKVRRRLRRKCGLRKRLRGTADRPRLTVFRSAKHIYAQIIDDDAGRTLCHANTRDKAHRGEIVYGGNIAAAKVIGARLAEQAKALSVETVCFDRNGYRYHGRLKALADAAREGGLKF